MKLGDKFEQLVKTIYTSQKARVLINGEMTKQFQISKGVRQGCPLSPLLFIITLEILLNKIRDEQNIKGTKIRSEEYKLQAFADDLVFFLEDPLESGQNLIKTIEEYGECAGLKINKQKTKFLTKNMTVTQKKEMETTLGLQQTKKIKYLGINLTGRCSSIKEDNYYKLVNQTKMDLEKWGKLQISLMGRIATIKMNILPKFLFLFQTAPVKLEMKFFTKLNQIISKFIWQGKKPRIKLKDLQDNKSRGGFGLPDLKLYYTAAQLVWIKDWINIREKRTLYLEGHDLQKGWHAYLWEIGARPQEQFKRHMIRDTLLKTWNEIKRKHYLKLPNWVSTMEALIYPNAIDITKTYKYKDILDPGGKLKTREELAKQNIIIDWWPYLQVQSRYQKDIQGTGIDREIQKLDKLLLGPEKQIISKLYQYLLEFERAENIIKGPMIAWARNIGHEIHLADWEQIWIRNLKISKAITYKENFYKMFYRWHLAPSRLAKIYPNSNSTCSKCKREQGTFFHTWWSCPKAKKIWKLIHNWLQETTERLIEFTPEFFLLGILRNNYPKEIKYLLILMVTAARIKYAQKWKEQDTPSEIEIIKKIYECAEMDRLTITLKGQKDSTYFGIWNKWYIWNKKRSKNTMREKEAEK